VKPYQHTIYFQKRETIDIMRFFLGSFSLQLSIRDCLPMEHTKKFIRGFSEKNNFLKKRGVFQKLE